MLYSGPKSTKSMQNATEAPNPHLFLHRSVWNVLPFVHDERIVGIERIQHVEWIGWVEERIRTSLGVRQALRLVIGARRSPLLIFRVRIVAHQAQRLFAVVRSVQKALFQVALVVVAEESDGDGRRASLLLGLGVVGGVTDGGGARVRPDHGQGQLVSALEGGEWNKGGV